MDGFWWNDDTHYTTYWKLHKTRWYSIFHRDPCRQIESYWVASSHYSMCQDVLESISAIKMKNIIVCSKKYVLFEFFKKIANFFNDSVLCCTCTPELELIVTFHLLFFVHWKTKGTTLVTKFVLISTGSHEKIFCGAFLTLLKCFLTVIYNKNLFIKIDVCGLLFKFLNVNILKNRI